MRRRNFDDEEDNFFSSFFASPWKYDEKPQKHRR